MLVLFYSDLVARSTALLPLPALLVYSVAAWAYARRVTPVAAGVGSLVVLILFGLMPLVTEIPGALVEVPEFPPIVPVPPVPYRPDYQPSGGLGYRPVSHAVCRAVNFVSPCLAAVVQLPLTRPFSLWWVSRWIRRLLVVTGARCPLTKPVVTAVELQATTGPRCSRGVQPGGICVWVGLAPRVKN
jgi:hypothetical protein